MLDSFLIIKDGPTSPQKRDFTKPPYENLLPEHRLSELGFRMLAASGEHEAKELLSKADAALLYTDSSGIRAWSEKIGNWRRKPVIWWCEESGMTGDECRLDFDLDGILYPQLSDTQIHWTLALCSRNFLLRTQWHKEREQLLSRLEERKWIDRAKAVLCELKGITEAEAYEYLRNQAMNDRKRLSDVASSIVRVYELVQAQKERRMR